MLWDIHNVLLVLHVYCNELVTNLWCVLSIVDQAELLCLDVLLKLWVGFKSDTFALNFLAPSIFIETFSEENDIGQNSFVIVLVYSVAHSVEIEGEDLVNQHLSPILVRQIIIVPLPVLGVGIWRQR